MCIRDRPSWFCQFLGNTISEGNIYRSGANNSILSAGSVIGIYGWPLTKDWKWPYNVGGIVRISAVMRWLRMMPRSLSNQNSEI